MPILSVCIHSLKASYFNRRYQNNYTPYGNITSESIAYIANY